MTAAATEVEAPEDEQQTPVVHPRSVVRKWMDSPWGRAQDSKNLIPGVGWISTAGHGGCVISPSRLALMPDYMQGEGNFRGEGLFYEEDCEWAKVFVVFEAELLASGDAHTVECIKEGHHTETLRNWFPTCYERFFGVTLRPGESFVKDERTFYAEHAADPIAVAAFGDWHARVPAGMVGVVTRVGGHGNGGGAEQYFLVPEGEYDARGRFGFVVEPARHEEIEKFC